MSTKRIENKREIPVIRRPEAMVATERVTDQLTTLLSEISPNLGRIGVLSSSHYSALYKQIKRSA